MPANMREDTVIFEIREHLGVIAKKKNGWSRELNLVCWNNQEPPKFDVRDWSKDHKHMSRGITMYSDEMRRLFGLYMDWNNQITVERAQEEKRRNRDEYYRQREAIRERYSSEQKVVPDDPEDDFEETAGEAEAEPAGSYAAEAEAEHIGSYAAEAEAEHTGSYAAEAEAEPAGSYSAEAKEEPAPSFSMVAESDFPENGESAQAGF